METGELLKRCNRIIHISRKPTNEEFMKTARITALGMALFGLVGFIISIISGLIR